MTKVCARKECDNTTDNPLYCSRSCSVTVNNRKPKRVRQGRYYCFGCGIYLTRQGNKYCSVDCRQYYEYNTYIQNWLSGLESGNIGEQLGVSAHVRRYMFEKHNSSCQRCGWAQRNEYTGRIPLTIHHTDGNAAKTTPDNLELLCPNCHSLTATYGGSNRGNGRKARYTKVDK